MTIKNWAEGPNKMATAPTRVVLEMSQMEVEAKILIYKLVSDAKFFVLKLQKMLSACIW